MMTISFLSFLTFPPQILHHFSSPALMLCPQLHSAELCAKSALRRQHAKTEVERGLPFLPQWVQSLSSIVCQGRWEEHRKWLPSDFSSHRSPASSGFDRGDVSSLSPSSSVLWLMWKTTQKLWSCFFCAWPKCIDRRQGFPAGRREESWRSLPRLADLSRQSGSWELERGLCSH